jgi:pimeloyl-ACP methyl ester carboxylesterase
MVLLHGFPESWYEFRGVMPALLPGRTLIAIDLPGLGDSTGYPPDSTKKTMATYIHLLLDHLGKTTGVEFVGHDFGVAVSYALAAQYRTQASGLFLMDFPLPGRTLTYDKIQLLSWHFGFFKQQPLADQVIRNNVHLFLSLFYPDLSHVAQPVSPQAVDEYTRVYSRPQVLHVGLSFYRGTFEQDQADNTQFEKTPLTIPVHFLAEDGFLSLLFPGIKDTTPDAVGEEVPGAGHWIPEERPQLVIKDVDKFFK